MFISCFTFDSSTETLTDYDAVIYGMDVIILETIAGVAIATIDEGTFVVEFNDGENNIYGGKEITSEVILNAITEIGSGALFWNNIEQVFIPNSIITIGDSSFQGNQLTNAIILNSVDFIGGMHLTIIQRPNTKDMWLDNDWYETCSTENVIYNSNY